jgi:hypothetical protein
MSELEKKRMAAYIADYITDEIIRGNIDITKWMVFDAIEAYEGGAEEREVP